MRNLRAKLYSVDLYIISGSTALASRRGVLNAEFLSVSIW